MRERADLEFCMRDCGAGCPGVLRFTPPADDPSGAPRVGALRYRRDKDSAIYTNIEAARFPIPGRSRWVPAAPGSFAQDGQSSPRGRLILRVSPMADLFLKTQRGASHA